MTSKKISIVIAIQTLAIVLLVWAVMYFARDELKPDKGAEPIKNPPRISTGQGAAVVALSRAAQQASGIAATALIAAEFKPEFPVFGTVVNIQPLLELRTRYHAAVADAAVVKASLANKKQELDRLQYLYQENRTVSERAVQAAQSAWMADNAKLAAQETLAANLRDTIRGQWGEVLTHWATERDAPQLAEFVSHQETLVQISIPFDIGEKPGETITVEPVGINYAARGAAFISPSPQPDGAAQGRTFFYRAAAQDLRSGMRVTARVQSNGKAVAGVVVPSAAVVWYADKPWVYVQRNDTQFERREISTAQEARDGWFNTRLEPGTKVVVTGAQLLLSEESKFQIKNENED